MSQPDSAKRMKTFLAIVQWMECQIECGDIILPKIGARPSGHDSDVKHMAWSLAKFIEYGGAFGTTDDF